MSYISIVRGPANSIAELSDSQIQTIVDYFSNNPNTELPDDQDEISKRRFWMIRLIYWRQFQLK